MLVAFLPINGGVFQSPGVICLPSSVIHQVEIDKAMMWKNTLESARCYILDLAARAIQD